MQKKIQSQCHEQSKSMNGPFLFILDEYNDSEFKI